MMLLSILPTGNLARSNTSSPGTLAYCGKQGVAAVCVCVLTTQSIARVLSVNWGE